MRDARTSAIATFESLGAAQRWWESCHRSNPPLVEAIKCATCGAYFGQLAERISYRERYYHLPHAPETIAIQRRKRQA